MSLIYTLFKLFTVFQITNLINIFERSVKKAKIQNYLLDSYSIQWKAMAHV